MFVTKSVDKTLVTGSEDFIYTFNVSYSDLSNPSANGRLVDFFPDNIKYNLPKIEGTIKGIKETKVPGGTEVEFDFGQITAGTSINFNMSCEFGPGRVDGDTFTNEAKLYADNDFVTDSASTVTLKLEDNFRLSKRVDINAPVRPNQEIDCTLTLINGQETPDSPGAGYEIKNIEITDILPPELLAVSSFTPVGKDISRFGYEDNRYDDKEGSWNGNTLNFSLPSYKGMVYEIKFKVKVAPDVIPGSRITNIGTWTADGQQRAEGKTSFSVFEDKAETSLFKNAPIYAEKSGPIQYTVRVSNSGTVKLTDYTIVDTIPDEIDIEQISYLSQELDTPSYNILIESSNNIGNYQTIASNLSGYSGVYNVYDFISSSERVKSVKVELSSLVNESRSQNQLTMKGIVNNSAVEGSTVTNTANIVAQSSLGEITASNSAITTINSKSILSITKSIFNLNNPARPLDEIDVRLGIDSNVKGQLINPIFVDLLPKGLKYKKNSHIIMYRDVLDNKVYYSNEADFPITVPTPEVIENFNAAGETLVRFKFDDFTLLYPNDLQVKFNAIIEINPPDRFDNYGYLGNPGSDTEVEGTPYLDSDDLDGDGIKNENIAQSNVVSGTILSSSEFIIEKLVKGDLDTDFSNSGSVSQGGEIIYEINIANNQDVDLKNIELVDILPYVGDKGVLVDDPRGSQFDVYATDIVSAEITNVLGDVVSGSPVINMEYSTSNDPVRYDQAGTGTIGTGSWSSNPPSDITTLASVKITTGNNVILKPYEKLTVIISAKAPSGVTENKKAYNSFSARADKIVSGGGVEPLLPTEPNKVVVTVRSSSKSSIGNLVWKDDSGDGIYNTSEVGINGVRVELYDKDKNLISSTVTSNDSDGEPGYYLFTNLDKEDYFVKFIEPEGLKLTTQNEGVLNGSTPNPADGFTSMISLGENEDKNTIIAGLVSDVCQEKPVINAENKCIELNSEFNPLAGVTATDCDGSSITLTLANVASNNVDTSKEGLYEVEYTVTSPSNGKTTTKKIYVRVFAVGPRAQAITDIIESVSLEQTAISHILNAEGEKIQKAVELGFNNEDMLKINASVKSMTNTISKLESVLTSKLSLFEDGLCGPDCEFPNE